LELQVFDDDDLEAELDALNDDAAEEWLTQPRQRHISLPIPDLPTVPSTMPGLGVPKRKTEEEELRELEASMQ
jgi:hypothetical protein